ncbi:TolB family protein, partial [Rhodocaloribacter sp.]
MRHLLLGLFLLTLTFPALGQEAPRALEIDDYFRIKNVSDPQVSPDGQWVAYLVTETKLDDDERETSLWMIPAAGGEALRMTAEGYSASRPRWSPDGRYLSFTASKGEKAKTQVWAFDRRGGDARPLTSVKQGVSSYEWSPDGTRLLLSIRDPKPDDEDEPEPWVIDRLQFKRDYVGYLDDRHTHLYLATPGDSTLTQITSGPYDESQPVWSPDGTRIAFVSNRTDNPDGNDNTDLWIVAAGNTDRGQTLLQVTTNPGADTSPAWSPDGRMLAYVTVTEPEKIWYATEHLAVVPATGGEARVLTTKLDRNVSAPRFAADGRSIFFVLEDSAERHLAR